MTTGGKSPTTATSVPVTAPPDKPLIPRALIVLLGAGAAVLVLAGVRQTAWLIDPVFLALIVVIAFSPAQAWARRKGWPAWLTTLLLLVLVFGLVLLFVLVLVVSVAKLAALLPQYADHAASLQQNLTTGLEKFGVSPDQLKSAVSSLDPAKLVDAIGSALAGLANTATSLIFLLALLLFLTVEAGGMERRLAAIAGDRPHLETAFRSFAGKTRSYLVVTTVFGAIVAVLDGIGLAVIGVPLPVLWGVLAFITNFIPNVGFIIGLLPPALLALLDGGWQEMLLVIGLYCVFNLVIQSLIQPRFVGDSVGLSATVTFVALIFWAWLLGPLGALLAVPATLLVTSLLVDIDPKAAWARALLGSLEKEPKPPREPETPGRRSPPGEEKSPAPPPRAEAESEAGAASATPS
ncbi:MAG: AI-2E family transporter [Kineosporiaceae bacterium]